MAELTVPNYSHVPAKLYATGLYDLQTYDGQDAFTDAVVATLNGIDPNFRHLKKKPGQTHRHQHGEDSVLYLLPNNIALAVDFIGGAGGANPKPGWMVGEHQYTHADAHDPDDHGIAGAPPPPAPIVSLPGRAEMMDEGQRLDAYYSAHDGLQRVQGLSKNGRPDWEGVGAWLFDIYLHARAAGKPREEARAAYVRGIRNTDEWQAKHPGEAP